MKNFRCLRDLFSVGVLFSAVAACLAADPDISLTRNLDSLGFPPPIPINISGLPVEAESILKFDLIFMGFTNVQPEQAKYLINGSVNGGVTSGRVVEKVNKNEVLAKGFSGGSQRTQVHALADLIAEKLTGRPGIAQTKIAFKVQPHTQGNGEIYIADYDSHNAQPVTQDNTIAAARLRSPEQMRAILDEGPFLAPQAKERGLVDDLLFEDQAHDRLKSRLKQAELHKVSLRDYVKIPAASLGLEGRTRFALVVGEGAISRGGESDPFSEEEGIRSGAFRKMLREIAEDDSIKGVILRVNSPGGDAIASDEILREVRRLSARKPLVVSMSDLAASGGYQISMSGDPVIAYPNTFTGSIGVVFLKLNLSGLYEKLGFSTEVMTRGRNADIDSYVRPMDDNARKKLKEGINYTYRTFLASVAEGRKKKMEEVEPLAEGRVWMGAQAKSNGLVDELGGLDRAIAVLRGRARLKPDEKIKLVAYPRRKSLLERFLAVNEESLAQALLDRQVRAWVKGLGLEGLDLNLSRRGAVMKVAPYTVHVQ